MSERAKQLRQELTGIFREAVYGDEGLTLTRATKAQHAAVAKLAEEMPLDPLLTALAVVAADTVGDAIEQKGLRVADYWRDEAVVMALSKRLAKAFAEPSKEFVAAFQSVMRGRG